MAALFDIAEKDRSPHRETYYSGCWSFKSGRNGHGSGRRVLGSRKFGLSSEAHNNRLDMSPLLMDARCYILHHLGNKGELAFDWKNVA